ncbi:MAG: lipid-A-disaccharide synthase [Chlamydiia bacterium]|nr:lipid-A-disaccharide synthase [Chlamydiia bacterium]MCP5509139.1 lipid-A-disaccharide synthase [Chlamydiales bacterium]
MKSDIFIFAGERSGDLHGAHLICDLLKKLPDLKISGVAGPKMRDTAIECLIRTEHFETMGFTDIIPALPRLVKLFRLVKKAIIACNPKLVVLIDYAEFNMRMAKALRKSGYTGKIVQYISPTVWAWRKNRIHTMAKCLDHVFCILPFEPACFQNTTLSASYIGHPLITQHRQAHYDPKWRKKFPQPILALFPGSRLKEIKRNLPIQIAAAQKLANTHDLQPIISCSHAKFLRPILKLNKADFPIVDMRHTHNLMKDASFALATSGTVTLELALYGVPTCVNFAISRFDQFIAQNILKINLPHYALPNIIAGTTIYPEFYGTNLKLPALISAMDAIISSTEKQQEIKSACDTLTNILHTQNSSSDLVLNFLV